jgi:Tfp pilus assembly protein PilF
MNLAEIISAAAFLLSVVALVLSTLNGWHERQRTIRSQLNEVLRQMAAVMIEQQKTQHEGINDPGYAARLAPAFNQQQSFLIQQAKYLAEQIPKLVTSVEWSAVGYFNALAGDLVAADSYYSRAVQVAPDSTYKLNAIVPYAWFLFTQRRFEEARDLYKKGLAGVRLSDNFTRYQKGRVYMFWGQNERDFAKANLLSQQAFEAATAEFTGMDIEASRESAQKELDAAKQAPVIAPPSTLNS